MGYIYKLVDDGGGGGSGTTESVANFSALPPSADEAGFIWFVENSQGTAWLPGGLGGNYYPEGSYYSNGTDWIFQKSASQATQAETDAGIINDKFVTPFTLEAFTKWSTKENVLTAGSNITIDRTNPAAPVISSTGGSSGGFEFWRVLTGQTLTIEANRQHAIHNNFYIQNNAVLDVEVDGQFSIHDGFIENNGTIINNGHIFNT